MPTLDGGGYSKIRSRYRAVGGSSCSRMPVAFRRTQLPVRLARSVLDLIGKRVESRGYFAVECLGSQATQFDNLVLDQGQPLDVAAHDRRL
jgi:hypothetical protein